MNARDIRTAAVGAFILTLALTASPMAGQSIAQQSSVDIHAQCRVGDTDPMVPMFTPRLERAREWVIDDKFKFKVVPFDIELIPRKHPLKVDLSKARGVADRNGMLIRSKCIEYFCWTGVLVADCNDDLAVDAADIRYLVDHLYNNGPEPVPDSEYTRVTRSDFNCDAAIDVQDLVLTIYYRHGFADPKVPFNPEWLREELRKDSLGVE